LETLSLSFPVKLYFQRSCTSIEAAVKQTRLGEKKSTCRIKLRRNVHRNAPAKSFSRKRRMRYVMRIMDTESCVGVALGWVTLWSVGMQGRGFDLARCIFFLHGKLHLSNHEQPPPSLSNPPLCLHAQPLHAVTVEIALQCAPSIRSCIIARPRLGNAPVLTVGFAIQWLPRAAGPMSAQQWIDLPSPCTFSDTHVR
jgi:hypothetical protein